MRNVLQDEQELARGRREAERGGEKEEREGENIKLFRKKCSKPQIKKLWLTIKQWKICLILNQDNCCEGEEEGEQKKLPQLRW